ncbi:MAG: hypothetical protein KC431_16910, partial [Myxococcales bacterium]|nr:hypothetical protein [Myxococcales bacterium]
ALLAWPRTDPCGATTRQLDGIWDAPRRSALEARFAAATVSHADDSRERVGAALDGWSSAWTAQHEGLCRDEQRGRVSDDEAEARGRCLLRQRAQVRSLVEALSDPDAALDPADAVRAATALPRAEACADVDTLLGFAPPPPSNPGSEVAVEALRRDIDEATGLRLLGRFEPGLALIEDAHARAQSLGYAPVLAEAKAELASYELTRGARSRGHALYQDAVDLAEASRHDVLAATLWTTMAMRAASEFADAERSTADLRRATAAWTRVPPPIEERAQLGYVRALVADLQGQLREAEAELREAIALVADGGSTELPAMHLDLAKILYRRDPQLAWPVFDAAIATSARIWGPRHPETARYRHHYGLSLRDAGLRDAAARELEAAATIWSGAFEAPHPP